MANQKKKKRPRFWLPFCSAADIAATSHWFQICVLKQQLGCFVRKSFALTHANCAPCCQTKASWFHIGWVTHCNRNQQSTLKCHNAHITASLRCYSTATTLQIFPVRLMMHVMLQISRLYCICFICIDFIRDNAQLPFMVLCGWPICECLPVTAGTHSAAKVWNYLFLYDFYDFLRHQWSAEIFSSHFSSTIWICKSIFDLYIMLNNILGPLLFQGC